MKRRDFKRMNEILSMDISSGRGYSDEDCRMYESALCAAVFRTDNPVARCIHREVNFDSVPFPSRSAVDGFTHITGLANPVFLTMLACHPDSKVKKNVVMATVPPEKFELFLQNAFLSYLAAFRNRSEVRIRLASDRRFATLYDPSTGEVVDSPSPDVQCCIDFADR